jgi:hypothetical protein
MHSVPMYQLDFKRAFYRNVIYMIVWNGDIRFIMVRSLQLNDRRQDHHRV